MRIVAPPSGAHDQKWTRLRGAGMKLRYLLALGLLSACGGNPTGDAEAEVTASSGAVDGEAAYLEYCAGCHETGMLGAPVVGDASYWRGRSTLWQAVLMEHAREGYYDMPARGSRPDLSDETVNAAVEHMMKVTFPDRPPDQETMD